MYIIIIGGGKVGTSLAKTLQEKAHDLVIIEKDEEISKRIAEEIGKVLIINGDGCDPRCLEDAGIERAQVVAAVTGDDEDNLIITQLAKESFRIPRVIARINNPKNERIFHELGITGISSTTIISKLVEEETSAADITTLLTLKKGQIAIVEVALTAESPVINSPVKDLKLPSDCVLTSIIRGEKVIFPRGDTMLRSGDSVIAFTAPEREKEIRKIFLGKV